MGPDSRNRGLKFSQLLPVIAEFGAQLDCAAKQVGGRIKIDPVEALSRDLPLESPGIWSPNRHCRMVESRDGWIAVNLAREDDRASIPAWLGSGADEEHWHVVIREARSRDSAKLIEGAVLLGLPVAEVSSKSNPTPPKTLRTSSISCSCKNVLDMSALWAGPYCGALLAEAGFEVTKIEAPSRPDPTRLHTPKHNARLNDRKLHKQFEVSDSNRLIDLVARADILITSSRPHALARLGLDETTLGSINPGLIHIAITAHGWSGEAAMRVGFGDDCAAAGGLVDWMQGEPRFIGDALADPLTGMAAALAALEAYSKGIAGRIDCSLAATAADFAQAALTR